MKNGDIVAHRKYGRGVVVTPNHRHVDTDGAIAIRWVDDEDDHNIEEGEARDDIVIIGSVYEV